MLTLIVHYQAQPTKGEVVASTLAKHVAATRTEPGCLTFIGYRSRQDPDSFMLYEQYVDQESFDAHRQSPHFQRSWPARSSPCWPSVSSTCTRRSRLRRDRNPRAPGPNGRQVSRRSGKSQYSAAGRVRPQGSHSQLADDRLDVVVDGPYRQHELFGDLAVLQSSRHQFEHVELPAVSAHTGFDE